MQEYNKTQNNTWAWYLGKRDKWDIAAHSSLNAMGSSFMSANQQWCTSEEVDKSTSGEGFYPVVFLIGIFLV